MILGIGGEKRSGKDTVTNYLVKEYGYTKKAYADNLRQASAYAFEGHIAKTAFFDDEIKEMPFPNGPIIATFGQLQRLMNFVIKQNGHTINFRQANEMLMKWQNKRQFETIRDILQFVGTEILRDTIHPDYHYKIVADYIKFSQLKKVSISDCRFKNERDRLREDFTGKIILVERPSLVKNASSGHASENSLGDRTAYDYVIINDGTLEDLYGEVDKIMTNLGIKKNTYED